MRSFQLPIPLALMCISLAFAGGCGLASDDEGPLPVEGEGGSGGGSPGPGGTGGGAPGAGGSGGGSPGPGGTGGGGNEDPSEKEGWHCASGNWSAVLEDGGAYTVATDHYRLELEVDSKERAEEMGRMAEAAWLAFTEFFEKAPALEGSERLTVSFFSSHERFQDALAAIGASAGDAGGYYAPSTRTAYLYEQPNPYYTNVLFLHEMTHQFHYLARTGNQNRPSWYVEGIAEYLGRHDWDGRCIRLGVIPMLSWEDLPAKALESVSTSGLDTTSIVSGTTEASRAESWAIVAYLDRAHDGAVAEAFASYRESMDAGSPADPSVLEDLVGPLSDIDQAIATWLPTAQEPLSPIYTEWMHVAPGTVHSLRTGRLTLAHVKEPHDVFEVTVTPQSKDAHVGVLAGFTDTQNYVAYFVDDDRQISEWKSVDGVLSWNIVSPEKVSPNDDGSFTWTVSHTGSGTQVEVNGISLPAAAGFEPVSGPAAYDADAIFSRMKWE